MDLKKAALALRSIGLPAAARTAWYAFIKDQRNRFYAARRRTGKPVPPGALQEASPVSSGARFRFAQAELEAIFLAQDLVRLSWSPGTAPAPYALARQEWPPVETQLSQKDEEYILSSQNLEIVISQNGSLLFRQPGGDPLRSELPPERQERKLNHTSRDNAGMAAWVHNAHMQAEECIYGLGERAAPINRRGGAYRMWNSDPGGSYDPGKDPLYLCIPAYLSLHRGGSCLVFYENSYPASFDFRSAEKNSPSAQCSTVIFEGGMLRYYFMAGAPDQLLERYTELTGRPSMPPRWALGYHQSRWGYKTEADVRRIAAGFKEHEMPLSAIHLDIDYMDGYRVFTINQQNFPDLLGLSKDLAEQGVRLVAIVDPGVKVDTEYSVYQEGRKDGYFCNLPGGKLSLGPAWPGWSAFPDFTDPFARHWWGEQYRKLLDLGIAGFWHDMNEPAALAAWGDMTLPMATQHKLEGCPGDHQQAHNLYGLLMNRASYEGLRLLNPEQRPWIFTRSGWAGVQRYAWNWTGDTNTSWPSLRQTIPTLLGLGLSGLPFSGPDIGGFSGDPSAELYLRWFELSAFLPLFRTHSATGLADREPWVYGEPVTSIAREYLRLRYRLMPFFYSLAWEACQSGCPLVRPLFWLNPAEPSLWKVDDSFLLGDAMLVAPVLEESITTRVVRLPGAGQPPQSDPLNWYDLWTSKLVEENGDIVVSTPPERTPVFVRAGAIIPMESGRQLALHVYAPVGDMTETTALRLYSDAGDGFGDWRLDTYRLSAKEGALEIIRQSRGNYPFPYNRVTIFLHGASPALAVVDGKGMGLKGRRLELENFERIVFIPPGSQTLSDILPQEN